MAKYYCKQDLIRALQDLAVQLGRAPEPDDLTEPSASAVLGYFKKWPKALKAAGIKEGGKAASVEIAKDVKPVEAEKTAVMEKAEVKTEAPCTRRYSKTIIAKMLLEECNRLGKKPTRKEIDENKDLPTVGTILKYFETTRIGDVWDEVLK